MHSIKLSSVIINKKVSNEIFKKIQKIHQPFAALKFANRLYSQTSTNVPFTSDTYKVKRNNFSVINDDDINIFKKIVGESNILLDDHETASYNTDWLYTVRGKSSVVLKPRSTEQVTLFVYTCIDFSKFLKKVYLIFFLKNWVLCR